MDAKVVRFFPLALSILYILREVLTIIFGYHFDVVWYFTQSWDEEGIVAGISGVIAGILKILIILGGFYSFKLLNDGKIKLAKVFILFMFGGLFLFGFLSVPLYNYMPNEITLIFGLLIFLVFVVTLILILLVKDPNKVPKPQGASPKLVIPRPSLYQQVAPAPTVTQNVSEQLIAVEKLYKSGSLTDAEFKAAKKKILD